MIIQVSMKFVKICDTRKCISEKLFKTNHQQKFMAAIFPNFVIDHRMCKCFGNLGVVDRY